MTPSYILSFPKSPSTYCHAFLFIFRAAAVLKIGQEYALHLPARDGNLALATVCCIATLDGWKNQVHACINDPSFIIGGQLDVVALSGTY